MSGNTATSAYQKVALRTPVLLKLVDGLNVLLQLVLERETFATLSTGERLDSVSRVETREVTVEVERRGESLEANVTAELLVAVTESVLLQRAGVLESFATGLTNTLPLVRVAQHVPPQVTAGQEGGRANITGELLLLLPTGRVLELLVYPQVVLLAASEPAVLADPGALPTVSPGVDEQPGFLAEHFLTDFTGIALGMDQVLVLVPQLIGGKLLITELTVEPFLLLSGMIS